MQDNWTDLKKQYEAIEEEPTQNLWNRLEAKLDSGNEGISQEIFVKKTNHHFWKFAAVVIILITVSGLIWNNFSQKNQQNIIVKSKVFNPKIQNQDIQTDENFVKSESFEDHIPTQNSAEEDLTKTKSQISISKTGTPSGLFSKKIAIAVSVQKNEDSALKNKVENFAKNSNSTKSKEKVSYIKADELLFGRELEKNRQHENSPKMGRIEFETKTPKSIKILGIELLNSVEKE